MSESIWKTAEALGFAQACISQYKWTMTADNVSPHNLERMARTIKTWLEQGPS